MNRPSIQTSTVTVLHGAAQIGGTNNLGTIYKLPHGSSTLQTLCNFTSTTGETLVATLTLDAAGNLFGTTVRGGAKRDSAPCSHWLIRGSGYDPHIVRWSKWKNVPIGVDSRRKRKLVRDDLRRRSERTWNCL